MFRVIDLELNIFMRQKRNSHVGKIVAIMLLLIVGSCSTEKNTFLTRTYHSTTARYNGLFNAKEMVRISMEGYRDVVREDYSNILPVELVPNKDDVVNFYPILDTAIAKSQKVIQQHSMPTASKPSQKKSEHARNIDKNWMMIGYASYLKQDYDMAFTTFEYVKKFFTDKPSSYSGELWQVKTLIQMGNIKEAKREMQRLDKRVMQANANAKSQSEEDKPKKKTKKRKTKNVKKTSTKEEKVPSLPKGFDFELAKTKAMLAFAEKDELIATEQLKKALKKAKTKYDKARINFILGQLLQKQADPGARMYYSESIKKDAPFEMSFNAKINRAVVSDLDNNAMIKELNKLAKEVRYLEYRDQIYFAMSKIELTRPDRETAKSYLSKSVFYSLNNDLQKGMSYEKLGDLSFEERNYVPAQRYYDSSALVIPDTYINYEVIKNKADKLAKLVEHIDVITFEDSVQKIAKMDDRERENFLKDVIKKMKKDEQERKEREAERADQMRKLQQTYAEQSSKGGSKFYFSNTKAMQEGLEEFRRVWGQRENEDYWRLSNKPPRLAGGFSDDDASDTLIVEETQKDKTLLDSLSVDDLLTDIPLTDSTMAVSNEKLLEALYGSGMIYKEQLEENELAATQFQRVIDHNVENVHNVMSAFQLYKINEKSGNTVIYRDYILDNYPNSDYANYLRDPDFFVKKKEREALALKDYLRSVSNFEYGLFYPVILKADKVIDEEPNNAYRKEYFLLKAMAMGRVNRDKTSLIPVLEQAIEEYPGTEVAMKAQEMLGFITNGLPEYKEYVPKEPGLFSYETKEYYVIIELKEGQSSSLSSDVSNFNREYFGRLNLSSKLQLYNMEKNLILIREFKTASEAKAYISDMRKARRYVNDLKGNEMLVISKENFKIVLQEQKLDDYRLFHEENFD